MTLNNIYNEYVVGSQGFCIAVETHCGFEISRTEIERIAERAETAERFEHIWENQTWWADDGKARQLEFTRVA